jgi:tetratricopeptide (TPR) repeat protein
MKTFHIAAFAVSALAFLTLDADARVSRQQIEQCTDVQAAPNLRVDACTVVIREGRLDRHNLAIAYTSRGNAYWASGDEGNARADYNAALELDPDYAPAFLGRGNTYLDRRDYQRAISEYGEGLRRNPQLIDGWVNRGLAHYAVADLDGALADFNHAAELQPALGAIFDFRAAIYLSLRRYDDALADFDHAASLAPDEPFFLTDACRLRAGRLNRELDRARADCERAVMLSGGSADARFGRGLVSLRQNRWQDAWSDFDGAQSAAPGALNLFGRGVAAALLNRRAEAQADMTEALSLDPGVADRWNAEFRIAADPATLAAARASRRTTVAAAAALPPAEEDAGEEVIVRPPEVDARNIPVCRAEVQTGSVLRQSVCTTPREDERNMQRGQEIVERLQRLFENSRMSRARS